MQITFPYVAVMVLLLKSAKRNHDEEARDDDDDNDDEEEEGGGGAFDVAVFRNAFTGEWVVPQAHFSARHQVASCQADALRACAAEAVLEQTCGVVRIAPAARRSVLRDELAVLVPYEGGADNSGASSSSSSSSSSSLYLDPQGRPRPLLKIFAVHVDGIDADDCARNRLNIQRNLMAHRSTTTTTTTTTRRPT